jgi:Mce-associated membrane protein
MRWFASRGAGDLSAAESVEETPAESVHTVTIADDTEATEAATEVDRPDHDEQPTGAARHIRWSQAIVFVVLPALALLLASVAGFLKWQDGSAREAGVARAESVRAATDSTIALLSYKPDTVEKDLDAARSRLTGSFLNAYTSLTHDVVIPGAKQKQISATATVPAAASTSATENHAVVLLFVNQSVIIGQDAPTSTASSVRVTLDKVGGRWLISQFDPV